MAKQKLHGSWADPSPMDILPISVGFAVSYLDGALAGEHPEVKRMWQTVREHLMPNADAVSSSTDTK